MFGSPTQGVTSGGFIYGVNRNLQFRTSTNYARMVVTEAGRVGIGNTSPAAKLDVEGDGTTIIQDDNATNSADRVLTNSSDITIKWLGECHF